MFMKRMIIILFSLIWVSFPSWANIIHVPIDQPTIQLGINDAENGDTVLVAPGTYYENIHFRGKGIMVASHYILNSNVAYVESTIINGGASTNPDTGSCVLIVSDDSTTMQDTSAALIGFTITQGTGTRWLDEHGAGFFREGGGILIQYLSPRIAHNIIVGNQALYTGGVTSSGGGALRCGDGNPCIRNNIIVSNSARYGGGIVLNFTGALIKNNIIAYDTAYGDYGGGGAIWSYANSTEPKIIENNTIVHNSGGGLRVWASSATVRNNIIWGNAGYQIFQSGGVVTVTYSNVQGGWSGEGNIDTDPFFAAENFYLSDISPCIDAGDTSAVYNDPEDPGNPGYALWPSMGELRNDMGAYGGPGRTGLGNVPAVYETPLVEKPYNLILLNYPNPFDQITEIRYEMRKSDLTENVSLKIYDITGRLIKEFPRSALDAQRQVPIFWDGRDNHGQLVNAGVYICQLKSGNRIVRRKMTVVR